MSDAVTGPETARQIAAIYEQVAAPDWAATNLDALSDVLRDLTWLPEGPVEVRVPTDTAESVLTVLRRLADETAPTQRPVTIRVS